MRFNYEKNKNKNFLSVNNLEVSFFTHAGEVKAVRGISYTLEKGEDTEFRKKYLEYKEKYRLTK